jgi:hypothetical protein
MGMSGGYADVDTSFSFEVKFMSLLFLHIGKGFTTKDSEAADIRLDTTVSILVSVRVPGYTGEIIWPLTLSRMEAVKHNNAFTSRPLTTPHELEDGVISNEELIRILTKLGSWGYVRDLGIGYRMVPS